MISSVSKIYINLKETSHNFSYNCFNKYNSISWLEISPRHPRFYQGRLFGFYIVILLELNKTKSPVLYPRQTLCLKIEVAPLNEKKTFLPQKKDKSKVEKWHKAINKYL